MDGTVDGFRYGAVTPVAAYLMACLGGALGLRCIVRSLPGARSFKPGSLVRRRLHRVRHLDDALHRHDRLPRGGDPGPL
ncbi:hypothetical protein SVIOM74S_07487 [Streptomyces violarus]